MDLVLQDACVFAREGPLFPPPSTLIIKARVTVALCTDFNSFPSAWHDSSAVLFGTLLSVQVTSPEGLLHCVINVVKLQSCFNHLID